MARLPLLLPGLLLLLAAQGRSQGGSLGRSTPPLDPGEPPGNDTTGPCLLPVQVGPCRAALPRFFFNGSAHTCQRFVFGGCGHNANNFLTLEECVSRCPPPSGSVPTDSAPDSAPDSTPLAVKAARGAPPLAERSVQIELCGAEPEAGPCRAAFRRWFYDWKTGTCRTFIYGGCHGNGNNYLNQSSCMASCAVGVGPDGRAGEQGQGGEPSPGGEPDPRGGPGPDSPPPGACVADPDPGPCRAAFSMFYYDGAACRSFVYGGCRGNGNRFSTLDECWTRCGVPESYQSRGRWTAAIFLFVTLGIVSVLLLSTLVFITLRRHRLPRRAESFSDKEELLPDELSSVDSLGVPDSPDPPEKA